MSEPTVGPINQPDVFNIHAWDGRRWRGGMNRLTKPEAIKTAVTWSEESGARVRVYDPDGMLVFDSEATAMLYELIETGGAIIPRNVCLSNPNVPDSEKVGLFVSMGELRAFAAALARVGGAE